MSIEHVLEYTKVDFIKDRIIGADLKEKKLYSETAQYYFDYLIIGVGSEPAYFNIEGMENHSFPLWSLVDAKRIQKHITHMFELAVKEGDPNRRREMLTFVVGGGGFTGVEIMGELIVWVRNLCRKYDIPRAEVRLVHVEGLPTYALFGSQADSQGRGLLKKEGRRGPYEFLYYRVTPNSLTIGRQRPSLQEP